MGRSAPAMRGGIVNLREALEQVKRDQPHLTGNELRRAVRALRDQANAAETQDGQGPPPTPGAAKSPRKAASVGEAWVGLAVVVVGTQVVGYLAWGSPLNEPHWFDALHLFLLIAAVVG